MATAPRKKDTRPQLNIRVDDDVIRDIKRLRVALSETSDDIPTATDIIKRAVRYMAEREVGKGARR